MASPAIFAVIGDALPKEKRAMGFTVQSILKRVPIVLAPPIGGLLLERLGIVSQPLGYAGEIADVAEHHGDGLDLAAEPIHPLTDLDLLLAHEVADPVLGGAARDGHDHGGQQQDRPFQVNHFPLL